MKVVIRCVNCSRIVRRSNCYHVRLLGKINNSTMFEKPNWEDYKEEVFICKPCALVAGYVVRKTKKEKKENVAKDKTVN